jgi:hypothetical protein
MRTATERREAMVARRADFAEKDFTDMDFSSPYGYGRDQRFKGVYNGSDFRYANLTRCIFRDTDLAGVNFRAANLTSADLQGSNPYSALFENADLTDANLRGANLYSAELNSVTLTDANVRHARFGFTSIADTDLSTMQGLDEVVHVAPSVIDSITLRRTAANLADASDLDTIRVFRFLANAGVDDELLRVVRTWIGKPIEFYSVFVSHSSLDKDFARKLYADLRAIGVRCWFDEHQIMPGDNIMEHIDRGIRLWDKLLLVCSRHSLDPTTGWWIEQEIERALVKEREARRAGERVTVLVPVSIDDYMLSDWHSPVKATLQERKIGDFRRWQDATSYATSLAALRRALDTARTGA